MLQSTSLKVGSYGLSGMRSVVCMMMFIEVALETISESSVESYIGNSQGHVLECTHKSVQPFITLRLSVTWMVSLYLG